MSRSAKVTSIDAIAEFKVAVHKFADELRDAVTTLQLESARAMDWIENDRATYWPRETKRAGERLNEARNNLERARTSARPDDARPCYQEKKEVALAEWRLRYCEDQIAIVRAWRRKLQHETEEFRGKMGRLNQIADVDRGIAALERILRALDRYAERAVSPKAFDSTQPTSASDDADQNRSVEAPS